MWITIIFIVGVMFGACVGFVTLAMCTMAKGNADDQRRSDKAEIEFMRRARKVQKLDKK